MAINRTRTTTAGMKLNEQFVKFTNKHLKLLVGVYIHAIYTIMMYSVK